MMIRAMDCVPCTPRYRPTAPHQYRAARPMPFPTTYKCPTAPSTANDREEASFRKIFRIAWNETPLLDSCTFLLPCIVSE